ncbi:methylenetetrahydrofolate reductase [Prochlorococcus sp. MIT 1341]|uniref:methylenetetrahydrofolate reductase n=1 Tax=Prochlorococcus sp. MIT 1341 TaxID=3096221 RepID=UPI002A74F8BF|nr:methylenetetrahydrofolate reductase [Prochlorococcus sp. MIT 1341]
MIATLQRSLEVGAVTITAEIMPPRGADPSKSLAMAETLRGCVNAINVTDGSRAFMRMSSLALCKLLLDAGLEPILQMGCRDRNRIAIQGDLLGAHALGIRNVLCLTGDPVRVGDQPEAKAVNDYESVRLLQQIDCFNRQEDPVKGFLPDKGTNFFPGAAADPNCRSFSGLYKRLERKKAAGAKFLQTQMVMESTVLEEFCSRVAKPLDLPVLAGVFLLKSARNARFINKVVPGACIPEALVERLEKASDPLSEGVAIASEQVKNYVEIAQGVHLMAVKAENLIPKILAKAGFN